MGERKRAGIWEMSRQELAVWLVVCLQMAAIPIIIHVCTGKHEPVVSMRIDLNTAQKEELMSLPGMNSRRARAILQTREKRGRFKSMTEIGELKGMTKAYLARIEDLIEVK